MDHRSKIRVKYRVLWKDGECMELFSQLHQEFLFVPKQTDWLRATGSKTSWRSRCPTSKTDSSQSCFRVVFPSLLMSCDLQYFFFRLLYAKIWTTDTQETSFSTVTQYTWYYKGLAVWRILMFDARQNIKQTQNIISENSVKYPQAMVW